ncbi:hypothetical protein HHI36_016548, partial [Cryptolaemus montrouzieri]
TCERGETSTNRKREQDFRTFYEKVNIARKSYKPQTSQSRNKNGDLVTSKKDVLQRLEEHFQGILGSGQPTTGDEEKGRAEGNHEEGDQLELPTLQE